MKPEKRIGLLVLAALCLILASCLTASLYLRQGQADSFTWDDSEYLSAALDTYDNVASQGLVSWPGYIATSQGYGKPPLLVNLMVVPLLAFGRDHAFTAAGMLEAGLLMALGAAVFFLLLPSLRRMGALLGVVAVLGFPAMTLFSGMLYPEVLISLLTVLVIFFLAAHPEGSGIGRAAVLGVLLGLGLLSKTTFPLLVGLPILWWLVQAPSSSRQKRTQTLAVALIVMGCIASVWYLTNLKSAVEYIQFSAKTSDAPDQSTWKDIVDWIRVDVEMGVGFCMLAVLALAALLRFADRTATPEPAPVAARQLLILTLLGGLPFLFIALWGSIHANGRHPLPNFVLLQIAAVVLTVMMIRSIRRQQIAWVIACGILGAQFLASRITQVPSWAEALRHTRLNADLWNTTLPTLENLAMPVPSRYDQFLNNLDSMAQSGVHHWYLGINNNHWNVPKLILLGKLKRVPIQADWLDYFYWSPQETQAAMNKAKADPSAGLIVENAKRTQEQGQAFLNPRAAIVDQFVNDSSNGFRLLLTITDNDPIRVFTKTAAGQLKQAQEQKPKKEQDNERTLANFSGRADLLSASVKGGSLSLAMRRTTAMECSYKLMLHAYTAKDQKMMIWDRELRPPICEWPEGKPQSLVVALPVSDLPLVQSLDIGLFDEADRAHNWPPLRLSNGEPAFRMKLQTSGKAQ